MLFVPGITAATATEFLREDEERTKKRLEEISATPTTYERVLQKMDEETKEIINRDEEKLRKEAHKIAHLQRRISKGEEMYAEMQRELCEREQKEAEFQEKKLKKAKVNAERRFSLGHPVESPAEKIEEVLHHVKDFAKDVLDNVADFAGQVFAEDKGSKEREPISKREKKLRKAAEHINELKKNLTEKWNALIDEDDKILSKEAHKIALLQQQLEEEEKNYVKIEAELAEDLQYEARIREEERKLREFELNTSATIDQPHHRCHQHHCQQQNRRRHSHTYQDRKLL